MRYPGVEFGTALLFAWLGAHVVEEPTVFGSDWLVLGVMLTVTSALIALTLIDLDYRILPDEITKPGIVLGPVLAFCAPELQHDAYLISLDSPRWAAALSGVAGAAMAGGVLWAIGWLGTKALKKDAMGFGDVKMIAAMGGCLGHWALLSLAVAALCGAVIGIVIRVVTAGRYIPFGPFLAVGMWTVMLWGPEIWSGYIDLFRP
jgi:leader peptidase (prepilin peptidase)/N-methyltransferase